MCRYGFFNYKFTHGCFRCRVGFKRRNLVDLQPDAFAAAAKMGTSAEKDFHCPNCGGPMTNLGRDLRLPAKTKKDEWAAIEFLHEKGFNFFSCGCQGIGIVPQNVAEAEQILADQAALEKAILMKNARDEIAEKRAAERRKRAKTQIFEQKMRQVKAEIAAENQPKF